MLCVIFGVLTVSSGMIEVFYCYVSMKFRLKVDAFLVIHLFAFMSGFMRLSTEISTEGQKCKILIRKAEEMEL